MIKPTILQRFICKELFFIFCLAVVAFITMVLIARGVQMRELFMGLELGFRDMLELFFYLSPFFLFIIMPIAAMLAVFLAFLRINSDNELMALKASGISPMQLLPAPLLLGFLAMATAMLVSIFAVSWGMSNFRSTLMDIAQTRARLVLQPGVFNKDIPGVTIFARQTNLDTGEIKHVIVEDRSRDQHSLVILAPSGEILTDEFRGEILFRLHNGRLYRTADEKLSVMGFGEYELRLDLAQLFVGADLGPVRPKEMSFSDLLELRDGGLRDKVEESDYEEYRDKAEVEFHKRLIFPVACLVMAFFAVPLACYFQGLGRQYGIVLCLIVFFVYYSLISFSVSVSMLIEGMPVWLLMWAPNIVFTGLGLYFFHLTLQEKRLNLTNLRLKARKMCFWRRKTA